MCLSNAALDLTQWYTGHFCSRVPGFRCASFLTLPPPEEAVQTDQKLEVRAWVLTPLAHLPKCFRSVLFLMAMGRLPTKAVRCRRSASCSGVNLSLCSADSKQDEIVYDV